MDEWVQDALQGRMREVPIPPERLAMFATARCDEVVAELTERIRDWCRAKGTAPHNALDIAASIALALAASGLAIGPQFYSEMMLRAQALDADGHSGAVAATLQAINYLSDTAPPLGP